jgi:hypothetical protein
MAIQQIVPDREDLHFPLAVGQLRRLGSPQEDTTTMSDKVARLGIERDNDLMYYIKNGDVWAVPRKQKGQPKGKAEKVASVGLDMDYSRYIYYLDGDGDVARKERALGGGRRSKAKAKAPKPTKAARPSAPSAPKRNGNGKKSEAQLDREIEECLAKAKKRS